MLWTYFRHQNCRNMGKYKWCNLQHVMHEPNTIDDACINISNGNANETNDIARKRNGNTHRKNAKPYAQIDGKSRMHLFLLFYMKMKWCNKCRHWNEVEFKMWMWPWEERNSNMPLERTKNSEPEEREKAKKQIKYIDFNKWHMENGSNIQNNHRHPARTN